MNLKRKIALTLGLLLVVLAAAGAWIWKARGPLLQEIALDLKAGAQARHSEKPFEQFLEIRYGPMTDPANRQKAFLGFFDATHIEGMHRLVGYMNGGERQTNIAATAEWIGGYRSNMTAAEREALATWVASPDGRARVQRASAIYRSRDLAYRAATEPVIRELMTTLALLEQNRGNE